MAPQMHVSSICSWNEFAYFFNKIFFFWLHGRSTMHEIWAVVRPAVCVLMFWICNRWWMGNQSQWPCVGPATSLTLGLFTKLGNIQLQQPKWKKQINCFSHSRLSRLIGICTNQTMANCPMRILGFGARFFCDVVFIFYAMREIFFFFFFVRHAKNIKK